MDGFLWGFFGYILPNYVNSVDFLMVFHVGKYAVPCSPMDPMMGYNKKASKNRFVFFVFIWMKRNLFKESKSQKNLHGTLIIPTEIPFSFCMLRVPLRFFG